MRNSRPSRLFEYASQPIRDVGTVRDNSSKSGANLAPTLPELQKLAAKAQTTAAAQSATATLDLLHNYLAKRAEIRHVIVETRARLSATADGADRISKRLERIGVRVIASDIVYTSPAHDLVQGMLNDIGLWKSEEHGRAVQEGKRRAKERREAVTGSACRAATAPAEGTRR